MIPTRVREADRSAPVAALLVVGLAALAVAGVATGPAVAGDNVAIFSPTPHEVDADPGEEFEVDVWLRSHGGFEGDEVVAVDVVARYHPDYLEVVDVERGPWLEGDGVEVETARTLADEEGLAIHEARRAPAEGTTGEDVVATLTVAVDADAPPSEATIDLGESIVTLESDYPQPVHDRNVTVSIAGGGDRHESFDHGDHREHLDGGAATGGDADGADEGSDLDEESNATDGTDDGTSLLDRSPPGLVPIAAGAAVVVVAALALRGRSSGGS